jgi:hypothetical protein
MLTYRFTTRTVEGACRGAALLSKARLDNRRGAMLAMSSETLTGDPVSEITPGLAGVTHGGSAAFRS